MDPTLTRHGHMRLCAGMTRQSEILIIWCCLPCRRVCRFGIMTSVDMGLTLYMGALSLRLGLSVLCSILLMLSQLPVMHKDEEILSNLRYTSLI